MFISHTKVSGVGDSADATLVQPSDWNAAHTITGLAALDAATGVVFFPPGLWNYYYEASGFGGTVTGYGAFAETAFYDSAFYVGDY